MKIFIVCMVLGVCSCLEDIGRSEPPYVEATATMPFRLITNPEKRPDMVADLAEKSEMNYRLLALKIMEKWQASIRGDKDFLKNLRQYKMVAFTVHKDGSIEIKGVEDPPASDGKAGKSGGKKGTATSMGPPAKTSTDN